MVFNYNDLPDLGAVDVDGDDPITFGPYVNGEDLVVITQNGFAHKFKREGITAWLAQQATNPASGVPVQLAQLSRAVADMAGDPVNTVGGRRRKRKTKKAARKLRRRRSTRHH